VITAAGIFGAGLMFMLVLVVATWQTDFNPWKLWLRYLDEQKLRRQLELERLTGFHERLKNATDELLAKANDLDVESKLLGGALPTDWSKALGLTCSQLVVLADQTKLIEKYLEKRQPRTVRQLLSGASNLAVKTGKQLKWLRYNADKRFSD